MLTKDRLIALAEGAALAFLAGFVTTLVPLASDGVAPTDLRVAFAAGLAAFAIFLRGLVKSNPFGGSSVQ